jgi:hypothetical protein
MSRAVPDTTAIAFAAGFYEALAFGRSVTDAFELGQTQVELASPNLIDTADIPQLIVRPGEDASKIFLHLGASPSSSSAEPAPTKLPVAAGKTPTTFSLRKLIGAVLKTSTDLDAFCIDHFPEVFRRFSSGMERPTKEGILLEAVDAEEILAALKLHDPAKLDKHQHLLAYT